MEIITTLITIYAVLTNSVCPAYRFRITDVPTAPATIHVVTQDGAYDKPLTYQNGYVGFYIFTLPSESVITEVSAQLDWPSGSPNIPPEWPGVFEQMSCKPTSVSLSSMTAESNTPYPLWGGLAIIVAGILFLVAGVIQKFKGST